MGAGGPDFAPTHQIGATEIPNADRDHAKTDRPVISDYDGPDYVLRATTESCELGWRILRYMIRRWELRAVDLAFSSQDYANRHKLKMIRKTSCHLKGVGAQFAEICD